MRVIGLRASNVMRLVAIDVTPRGDLVVVGGPNGAGKTSVLDSIAMALGGAALAPAEPIRAGEAEARIDVDLGALRVARTFRRERIHLPDCPPAPEGVLCRCGMPWGPTTSRLRVTSADGQAEYRSPQGMLDQLLTGLTFDPTAFMRMDEEGQAAELRRIAGIDSAALDDAVGAAYARRRDLNRDYGRQKTILAAMPWHEGAGEAEEDLAATADEMLAAERARAEAADMARRAAAADEEAHRTDAEAHRQAARVGALQADLAAAEKRLAELVEQGNREGRHAEALKDEADKAALVAPDPAPIRERLAGAEERNRMARANAARTKAADALTALELRIAEANAEIAAAEGAKAAALAGAALPVPGLRIHALGGPTLDGVPIKQASSAEQLRASVAIGLALNPKLKVLLVRDGNRLDEDSLAALARQAEEAGAQVWLEYVTKDEAEATVMIEEGRSRPGGLAPEAAVSAVQSETTDGRGDSDGVA